MTAASLMRETMAYRATLASPWSFVEVLRSLEHRVGVGRRLRDGLDHVPVLEDLAAFKAEDFHHRLSAGIVRQTMPMAVKDDVVAVGKDVLDLAASIRMIRHDPGHELLHAFHAVFDQRIVLAIGGSSVSRKASSTRPSNRAFCRRRRRCLCWSRSW